MSSEENTQVQEKQEKQQTENAEANNAGESASEPTAELNESTETSEDVVTEQVALADETEETEGEDTTDSAVESDDAVETEIVAVSALESEADGSEESATEATKTGADIEVDFDKLKQIVEGAIFAAAKPMTIDGLGNLFLEDVKPTNEEFKAVLDSLMEDYANRGVQLKLVSTGYRFQATEDVAPWVSRLWEEKPARYSRALLETLALIAYRQPITRGEIEEIRGVSTSSHIMKTLQEREWIRVVGHRDVPGRPAMYATTRNFLDYFNLTNIDELPSLAEIRDLDEINRELDLAAGDVAAPEATPQVEGQAESSEGEPDLEVEQEPSAELETDDLTQEVGEEPSPVGTNDQETEAETN